METKDTKTQITEWLDALVETQRKFDELAVSGPVEEVIAIDHDWIHLHSINSEAIMALANTVGVEVAREDKHGEYNTKYSFQWNGFHVMWLCNEKEIEEAQHDPV